MSQHSEERSGEPDNESTSPLNESKTGQRKAPAKRAPGKAAKPDELKGKPRKLMIPDGPFRRLEIWACKRRMTYSAVVTLLIEQNAPEIEFTTNKRTPTPSTE
jgi:hypothetical protein